MKQESKKERVLRFSLEDLTSTPKAVLEMLLEELEEENNGYYKEMRFLECDTERDKKRRIPEAKVKLAYMIKTKESLKHIKQQKNELTKCINSYKEGIEDIKRYKKQIDLLTNEISLITKALKKKSKKEITPELVGREELDITPVPVLKVLLDYLKSKRKDKQCHCKIQKNFVESYKTKYIPDAEKTLKLMIKNKDKKKNINEQKKLLKKYEDLCIEATYIYEDYQDQVNFLNSDISIITKSIKSQSKKNKN